MQGTAPQLSRPASVMAVKPSAALGSGTLGPSQHQVSVVTAAAAVLCCAVLCQGVVGRAGTEGLTDYFGALFVVSSAVEYVDIFKMVDILLGFLCSACSRGTYVCTGFGLEKEDALCALWDSQVYLVRPNRLRKSGYRSWVSGWSVVVLTMYNELRHLCLYSASVSGSYYCF